MNSCICDTIEVETHFPGLAGDLAYTESLLPPTPLFSAISSAYLFYRTTLVQDIAASILISYRRDGISGTTVYTAAIFAFRRPW